VKTSTTEQADDAAWLLKATGHAPAIVFGSSSGALTALDLVLRHAEVVRGAIVHEPSVFTCLPQDFVQEQFAELNPFIEQAVASGGLRAGHQAFLSALAGESGFERLVDAERRDRWLTNSEFMFGYEFPNMLLGYRPDPATIAAVRFVVAPEHRLRRTPSRTSRRIAIAAAAAARSAVEGGRSQEDFPASLAGRDTARTSGKPGRAEAAGYARTDATRDARPSAAVIERKGRPPDGTRGYPAGVARGNRARGGDHD